MRKLPKVLVGTLALTAALAVTAPSLATEPSPSAPSKSGLILRIQGYVDAMMRGDRAAILEHKDYFSTVFLASSGKVSDVTGEGNGIYRATLVFKTVGRYLQNLESDPHSLKKAPGLGEITRTVTFEVQPSTIRWHRRLTSPFVKSGQEKRYLVPLK